MPAPAQEQFQVEILLLDQPRDGRTGALNTRKILARFSAGGQELDGYYLIDLALFKSGMPLLFDPRYREMSYLPGEFEKAGLDPWVEMVTAYAREDMPDPQQAPVGLAGAYTALERGENEG